VESLRRGVRQPFSKSLRKETTYSWELHREYQRAYMKEVRHPSKKTCRVLCAGINEQPKAARLHVALSKHLNVTFGSLVTSSGERKQSEQETHDLLVHTHIPGSRALGRCYR
jgi:hypothetical protein